MHKISVVTVCYNAAAVIEETILSVLNQIYSNVEYIIIDGGSTDGTVDIIKKYANRIAYWISEPDKGIYDAMNKGIGVATGDFLNFMNAGDTFFSSNVIQEVFSKPIPNDYNVIYGKTKVSYAWGTYIITPPKIHVLLKKMCLCHQSLFVRTSTCKKNNFDISYRIIADYIFLRHLYQQFPLSFLYYPNVIACYNAIDGISSKNISLIQSEYYRIYKKSKKTNLKRFVKHLFPKSIRGYYRRLCFYLNPRKKRVSS